MKYIFLILLALASCSSTKLKHGDEFDNIIAIMKSRSPDSLDLYFDNEKKTEKIELNHRKISYPLTHKHSLIDVFVDLKTNKITRIAVFFWKDFDNYIYLKKRFGNYEWIEEEIKENTGDALSDLYKVKIPALSMNFTYDNNASQRKVMWIIFE